MKSQDKSMEWRAKPGDASITIPDELKEGLQYEIRILSSRKDFHPIYCKKYELDGQIVKLLDVFIDSSRMNARREVEEIVISWHEIVTLLNVGCMVIPIPPDYFKNLLP